VDHPAGARPLSGTLPLVIPHGLDATLVLARHGESTFIVEGRFQGQADSPLTVAGVRQAELLGRRLAAPRHGYGLPVPVGAPLELAHSPLQRTTQTAETIERAMRAAGSAVGRRADRALIEIGQGEWEGLHRTEIDARYAADLAAWRRRPHEAWAPGGESLPDVQARVRPALEALLGRLAEGRPPGSHDRPQVAGYRDPVPDQAWSIIVGHDGMFKVLMLTLFDIPLDRFWMWSLDLCGISVIELRAGRPVLRAHNLTAHLADLRDQDGDAQVPGSP
jgi:probable phosphoglycerate mutase